MAYHLVHSTVGEELLKTRDIAFLLVLGLAIWVAATVYYGYAGPVVLETTPTRYWISFTVSPVLSAAICVAVLRWRDIPSADWTSAMLLLAIPGMIGEAVVLSHLPTFMPRLHAASGGKYGAFLFATYALVLGVAEVVTLGAAKQTNARSRPATGLQRHRHAEK
jgi:uncharacterized membrane protein YhaH (DUF805 family)